MNSIRRDHFTTIVALAALALSGAAGSFAATPAASSAPGSGHASGEQAAGHGIVGVWRVAVQSYVCGTDTPIGQPFSSVLTFNEGGTLTGTTINPAFATGQRGIDQGIWSREERNTYRAKDISYLFFTTPASPASGPGFQAGSQILVQTITLDENADEFSSKATTEFFDTAGNSYRQGCATAVGHRFE